MSKLKALIRKVKIDYREFQATNQPMSEPWKTPKEKKDYAGLLTGSGLKHVRTSFGQAYKLWKLQITTPSKASEIIENFGKEKASNVTSEFDEELNKLTENMKKISEKDVATKTNELGENFKKNTKDTIQIFQENKENMKEFAYDRLKIMSDALRAFNQGYQEGKTLGENEALEKSPEELYDDVISKPLQDKLNKTMENLKKAADN